MGEVVLARATYDQVTYWQPPRWRSNAVNMRLGASRWTWAVMTAKNGSFALGYAADWSDRFVEALAAKGAKARS